VGLRGRGFEVVEAGGTASVWLITGCSTGLGRASAETALADGHQVAVTARRIESVQDLVEAYPSRAIALPLNVADTEEVDAAVGATVQSFGHIDVLVNNAGHGYRAAVEEGEDAAVRELFDTTLFGAVAMIRAVFPGMRTRDGRRRDSATPPLRLLLGSDAVGYVRSQLGAQLDEIAHWENTSRGTDFVDS
jgi:NAD(P)-dependent dehydrogenase (short-subunit alcohol dehydrogenase family)